MTSSGLVVVDKPAGITSHDVVARVRRIAGTRKVGHAGTLDPMATGVLVLGINRATRLLGHLLITDKAYDATIRLGVSTTTDDAEGEVLSTSSITDVTGVSDETIRAGLAAMVGEIDQVPSAVSAIKVDGKRAYERVRAGEQVELASRRVRIASIDVHSCTVVELAETTVVDVEVSVACSSGTYIRAIARDLGTSLGVGGHLTALRRTAVGPFTIDQAKTLDELAEEFTMVPLEVAARASFPAYDLDDAGATDVRFGRKIEVSLPDAGPVALFAPDGEFLALYEQYGETAKAVAVFTG
ncbi:MAG: truB [Marmoricola sp.]|nr:truB [Marmoricola sp.]